MKLSVIVPTWNAEKTIESCLESILGQTSVPGEIVVIDGGSTDSTLSLVKKHLRPQDTLLTEPDKGPYDAMNKGLAIAQGEILAILNSDDHWVPDTCETIQRVFGEFRSKIGIVHGDVIRFSGKSRTGERLKPVPPVFNYFCIGLPSVHPATFIHRKVYLRIGEYNGKDYPICADQDLVYRALSAGVRLKYVNKVLTHMRGDGLSSFTEYGNEINLMLDRLDCPRKCCVKILRYFLKANNSYYSGGFERRWILEVFWAVLTLGGLPRQVLSKSTIKLAIRSRLGKLLGPWSRD